MKKSLTVFAFSMLLIFSGCSEKNDNTSFDSESIVTSGTESVEPSENSSLSVNASSESLPLELGTWGTAAKYDPETGAYIHVPVRITNIMTGTEAETIFRRFTAENSAYAYTEPSEGCEWTVAEYEISLEDYPVPKGGVLPDIVSSVTAADGSTIMLDGKYQNFVTVNVSEEEYYFEGIMTGQIAYMMIKDSLNYRIVLGENGEQQAFFKAE